MDEEASRFTISMPKNLYEKFESFRNELDMSRSDCIRKAMQSYMIQEETVSNESKNIVGCISLIMTHEHVDIDEHNHQHEEDDAHEHGHEHNNGHDHPHDESHTHDHEFKSKPLYANIHQSDLIINNDIQHHFRDVIISTTHYHLEYERCLEVIAVSGPYKRVLQLKKDLQKLKSVISIKILIVENE